jgi:hypothetical protein
MDPKQPSSGHEIIMTPMPAAYFNQSILFRPAKSESCVPGGLTEINLGHRHKTLGELFNEMIIPANYF